MERLADDVEVQLLRDPLQSMVRRHLKFQRKKTRTTLEFTGTDDATNKVKQAVPNPFECIESDVEHDRVIMDLLARVRVSQSLFPSESSQVKDTTTTTLLLTPKPSRRGAAYEKLPGKTIQISKDAGGHLGIKFDDQLKVIAVSTWAKKFGIVRGVRARSARIPIISFFHVSIT